MVQKHRVVFGVVVAACIALGLAGVARANNDDAPSAGRLPSPRM